MSFCIFRSIVKVVYHLFGVSILKKCYPHLNQAHFCLPPSIKVRFLILDFANSLNGYGAIFGHWIRGDNDLFYYRQA